jgi:hypothetical protein
MHDLKAPRPTPAVTSFRLPANLLRVVDDYCATEDLTRSQLLRKCLKNFEPIKYQINDQVPASTTEQPASAEWSIKAR